MLIIPNIGQPEQVGNTVEDVGHLALYSAPSLVESFPASVIGTDGDILNPPAWAAACMGVSEWHIVADLSSVGGSISVDVTESVPPLSASVEHAGMTIEPHEPYLSYSVGGVAFSLLVTIFRINPYYAWADEKWMPPLLVHINAVTYGPFVSGDVWVDADADPLGSPGPISVMFCGGEIATTMTGDDIGLTGTLTITPTEWYPLRIPVV